MLTSFGLPSFRRDRLPPLCVSIGVFDGLHLGHREVIKGGIQDARDIGAPSAVLTFDRHPLALLRPEQVPPLLCSIGERLRLMEQMGVDLAIVVPFDRPFASQTPDQFLNSVLRESLNARHVVVGHDFRFGRDREGDAAWLSERISTRVVPPVEVDGERISSSRIRAMIAAGDIAGASRLLGRNFSIEGLVVPGNQLGAALGVPTANLLPMEGVAMPANGIYAGLASVEGRVFPAAVSIGERPTVPGAGFAIEAHLLDYSGGALYGRAMRLEFTRKLRDEERFDSVEDMLAQMQRDVEAVRRVLEDVHA
jgi:riboflavin kinase/FMN adenylyltransferase